MNKTGVTGDRTDKSARANNVRVKNDRPLNYKSVFKRKEHISGP